MKIQKTKNIQIWPYFLKASQYSTYIHITQAIIYLLHIRLTKNLLTITAYFYWLMCTIKQCNFWWEYISDKRGWGTDAVVFRICLYVGAVAFKREFQGSPLVDEMELWRNSGRTADTAENRNLPRFFFPLFTELDILGSF